MLSLLRGPYFSYNGFVPIFGYIPVSYRFHRLFHTWRPVCVPTETIRNRLFGRTGCRRQWWVARICTAVVGQAACAGEHTFNAHRNVVFFTGTHRLTKSTPCGRPLPRAGSYRVWKSPRHAPTSRAGTHCVTKSTHSVG